jgi:hypothetical protein
MATMGYAYLVRHDVFEEEGGLPDEEDVER